MYCLNFLVEELMPYIVTSAVRSTLKFATFGGKYIPNLKRFSCLLGLRWLHDGRCQSYIVLFNLMLSHDHRTMVAAYPTISRGRSHIVTDYRMMVIRWSCRNLRLSYDLDSDMLRSLKACRKAIVVCDC